MKSKPFVSGELEKVRQKLLDVHVNNVQDYEKKLGEIQKERQAVFQDAFQNDLKDFKTLGKIPSKNASLDYKIIKLKLRNEWN